MSDMGQLKARAGNHLINPVSALINWYHKWRWSRRNIDKLRSADAVVVSHTKSGRTWLRVLISYLYHLKYGTPASEIISFDNLHALNPHIPRIYFTRDTHVPTFLPGSVHVKVANEKKVLFLVRDPRDAAVSFYYHVLNRASDRELARKGISQQAKSFSLYDFIIDDQLGVRRIISHYNRWHDEMKSMSSTMVVKYEQMRADPLTTIGKIMRFIDHEFDHADLAKAVEFASFESLSRKEMNGFFQSGRLRPTNPADTDSFKVRRGKVGGYRDYFTEEENEIIDALVRNGLDPSYGYS